MSADLATDTLRRGCERNPAVEAANTDYELSKDEARKAGKPHSITYAIIERRHGLKPGQLFYYRANHLFRS